VKARLTVQGFTDTRSDVDAMSPSLSWDTLRLFLCIFGQGPLLVLDCKQAYLNASCDPAEIATLVVPPRLADGSGSECDGCVWKLCKAVWSVRRRCEVAHNSDRWPEGGHWVQ